MDTRFTFIRDTHEGCLKEESQFITFHFYKELDGELGRTSKQVGGYPGISTISPEEFAKMLPGAIAHAHPVNFDDYFETHNHKGDKGFEEFDPKCESFDISFHSNAPYDGFSITLPRYYDNIKIYHDAYCVVLKLLDLGELPMSLHEFAHNMHNAAKALK